jgi:hypothetical protein
MKKRIFDGRTNLSTFILFFGFLSYPLFLQANSNDQMDGSNLRAASFSHPNGRVGQTRSRVFGRFKALIQETRAEQGFNPLGGVRAIGVLGGHSIDAHLEGEMRQLVGLVSKSCVFQRGIRDSLLARLVYWHAQKFGWINELDEQAISFTKRVRSVSELEKLLAKEPCFIGVVDDQVFEVALGSPQSGRHDKPPENPVPQPHLPEPNWRPDPMFKNQGHHRRIGTTDGDSLFHRGPKRINRPVVVAVIDTGIDWNHPDLRNMMWRNAAGQVGYDFIRGNHNPMDTNGHGTHVAGLVGAERGNGEGGAGVAGPAVRLMALRSLSGEGQGTLRDTANAMLWATQNGAQVINLSLGTMGKSPLMEDALQKAVNAGAFVTMASGNGRLRLDNGSNFFSPGSYGRQIAGAMNVGATDATTGGIFFISNLSSDFVEIGAPGTDGTQMMLSTVPGGKYEGMAGTSMAAPLVAAAGALVIGYFQSRGRSITPAQVEEILSQAAIKEPSFREHIRDGRSLSIKALRHFLEQYHP